MDQITHDVRTAHWHQMIQECQQRPDGMSAKQWMQNHGVREKSYYYWQRRLRQDERTIEAGTPHAMVKDTPFGLLQQASQMSGAYIYLRGA